jgi:hypothetical protein
MHQGDDFVAIEVGIGLGNAQPDDYGSLADPEERSVLLRDVVGLATGRDDTERLERSFFNSESRS